MHNPTYHGYQPRDPIRLGEDTNPVGIEALGDERN